jgi:hypothetical protein
MRAKAKKPHKDEILETAKRERQERSRALVGRGTRQQESMFLIAPSIAKALVIHHRTVEF